MLERIRENLFFERMQESFKDGMETGKIVMFDNELYNKMNNTFIDCIPVSLYVKNVCSNNISNVSLDKSFRMLFCFENAVLVRANLKKLEYNNIVSYGWIEIGDYVYDPVLLCVFERKLFYRMYKPTNITRCSHEMFADINSNFYENIRGVTLDDFKIGGSKRYELSMWVSVYKNDDRFCNNIYFQEEFDKYLELVDYKYKDYVKTKK